MKKTDFSLFLIILYLINFSLISGRVSSNNDKWYRIWGGNKREECLAIALDSSENIYIAGFTESFGAGSYDICFVKYDNSGSYQWNKTWGGAVKDLCFAITIDSSNNIYLAGTTYNSNLGNYDMVLIKYNNLGNYLWNRTWNGGEDDSCLAMVLDSSENIYLAGISESPGDMDDDFCLVKYDNLGNYQWNKTWGGSDDDECRAIALDSAENIYLAGVTDFGLGMGRIDFCLVKFNNTGNYQWNKTWGGTSNDYCEAISLDSSENIYLAGSTYSFGAGNSDMVLIKYDNLGNYQWNKTWGGTSWDNCGALTLDTEDKIYLGGNKASSYCILKYNNQGDFQWYKSLNLFNGGIISAMILDSSENIYLAGIIWRSVATEDDFFLIKNLQNFEEIPIRGYDLILIISIMFLVLVVFIKLKFKSKIK